MHKHKKAIALKVVAFLAVALILISGIWVFLRYNSGIYLTQFAGLSHSQMMGYGIVTKNDKVIIIDGGTAADTENVTQFVNSVSGKVDHWFITHPHKDHASVLIDVINNTDIQIDNIYVSLEDLSWYTENDPQRASEAESLITALKNDRISGNVHEVSLNQEICIDNLTVDILGIKNPEITNNATNNSSIVFRITIGSESILFLGDTGKESSAKLIEKHGKALRSDIVQVAHHGQNGATRELYEMIDPEICLWPTPEWLWNNDAGSGEDSGEWKTKETRRWIDDLDVKQNIVAKDGNTTLHIW